MFTALGGAAANPTQVFENLPSSVVGLVSAFGRSPSGTLEPAYGLVFRFRVDIGGILADLGAWQSCGGLKMDFNPVSIKSGGRYTGPQYLPGEVSYPKIVLKRAIDKSSSDAVQRWLREEALAWIGGKPKTQASTATISLHNSKGERVLAWHLVGVRPSAWSGPDLDGGSSKVAVETLELVHEGFEVVATSQPRDGGTATKVEQVTLSEKEGGRSVTFANNPQKVTVERTTEALTLQDVTKAGNTGDDPPIGHKANTTQLKMYDLFIVHEPMKSVDILVDWMDGGKEKADAKKVKLPELLFKWGAFEKPVTLTYLSAEYNRFAPDGMPIRAKVTVGVTVKTTPKPGHTNPSSGGIPGRAAHTMVLDENLPLLAQEHYGSPARWRDIAEANGIDDPLRTHPGRRIFLPAAVELPGRS